MVSSRRGELSVLAGRWTMAAKALRPLPDKHKGLTDPEARVRLRYVDLAVNAESREMVRTRAKVLRSVRSTLDRARLPGGRDTAAAAAARRRCGPPVRHAPQRVRPADVPADRDRALPQAAGGRRPRPGLRDRPQLPQRGRGQHAQPRVHDAGGLRGVRRLHDDGRAHPRDRARRGARARLHRRPGRPRRRDRPRGRAGSTCRSSTPCRRRSARRSTWRPRPRRCASSPTGTTSRCIPPGVRRQIVLELYEQLVEHTLVQPTFVTDYPADGQAAGQAAPVRSPGWSRPGTSSSTASSSHRPTPSSTTRSSSAGGSSSSR